jgi:hypothetical protein
MIVLISRDFLIAIEERDLPCFTSISLGYTENYLITDDDCIPSEVQGYPVSHSITPNGIVEATSVHTDNMR